MRCSRSRFIVLFIVIIFGIGLWKFRQDVGRQRILIYHVSPEDGGKQTNNSSKNCTVDTCLDLLPCSLHDDQLTVFVEPLIRVFDVDGTDITPLPSREYLEMRSIIEESTYGVDNTEDACLVFPGFDTLNIYRFADGEPSFRKNFNAGTRYSKRNVLLFVFAGADLLDVKAITARSESHRPTFRRGFDISLPLWNPHVLPSSFVISMDGFAYFLVVPIKSASHNVKMLLKSLFNSEDCLVLDYCDDENEENYLCDSHGVVHNTNMAVKKSEFTIIDDRVGGYELFLMSALRHGSIPVFISDTFILPFSEVIDWSLVSLTFYHSRLSSVLSILRMLSFERKQQLRKQISFIYERYFSSLQKIVLTTLKILERRIITNSFETYNDWNCNSQKQCLVSPLFLPFRAVPEGFTAVILAYNKPHSLFAVIRLLARVPNLRGIVVVWNHRDQPPSGIEWPSINRPIHVIQMDKNLLSNRFILFSEITTEAVFSLDDDITALSVDEIEFAYQTWLENPDRLVGFLPRAAVFNESTKSYEYITEWINSVNIVLTGAAFYHKYYGMLYHELLPQEMLDYVEKNMNCEDIAMNFLISNITGKSPLKVTPRKKFVCPKCDSNGISPLDAPRLLQRSACINAFISFFGTNPLVNSVSRLDPVLYKTPSVDVIDPYSQVGPL